MTPSPSEAAAKVAQVAAGTNSSAKVYKRESNTARVLGAGCAGIAELMVFHPVDTTAKRLMSNIGKIENAAHLNKVVFRDAAGASVSGRFFSLFKIISDEGLGLYRGWGWTAARNAPGSFALFGGSAVAKEYFYKLTDYNSASWSQNFVASIAGASASLVVSAPLDVIKTRIQNRNFENPESGFRIVSNMMKHEGPTSFFKGLTPKLLMTGPKLVFSFWLAQTLIPAFGKIM